MSELQKQVSRARRRLNMQRFLAASVWCLAICFTVAAVALGITKIWPFPLDMRQWTIGWLVGAAVAGLSIAAIWTWLHRNELIDAAIEVDHRFGLKERVSSSLALTSEEAESDIGRALVEDATRRVSRLDVAEKFTVRANRWVLLPLGTGALAVALVFMPNPEARREGEAAAKTVQVSNQVKKSAAELKKKLANQSKDLDEKGLKEASKLVKEVEKGVDELSKQGADDRKKAMVKLNNLAKSIRQRRDSLQGSQQLQKQLNQMKDLKINQGPADKLAKALRDGDFRAALDQVKDLQKQLRQGSLSPEQQQQLAEQMERMREKLSQMAAAHEQAKEELRKLIEEKQAQGDELAAQKLQQKLDQLLAQDQQMRRAQQMAEKMQQMANAMRQGNQQQTAQQLSELAQELEALQADLDEMQSLDEALQMMASAKSSMNCESCGGMGCAMCQGLGFSDGMPGMGMGEGQGRGDRPEEQSNTNFYDSKVNAEPGKGRMVIVGNVRGVNKPGEALEAIKQAMEAAETRDENPLTNLRLPRAQREQARQYFDAVREGQ